jgi:hypothetical protein
MAIMVIMFFMFIMVNVVDYGCQEIYKNWKNEIIKNISVPTTFWHISLCMPENPSYLLLPNPSPAQATPTNPHVRFKAFSQPALPTCNYPQNLQSPQLKWKFLQL